MFLVTRTHKKYIKLAMKRQIIGGLTKYQGSGGLDPPICEGRRHCTATECQRKREILVKLGSDINKMLNTKGDNLRTGVWSR